MEAKKIERVFRDKEELPIGSDLGDNIAKALESSEYLIVICSPDTPKSYWVQQEIDTFINLHGRDKILAVLVEGEPSESFPEQLLVNDEGKQVEPLAADVRGKDNKEIKKKIRAEIVRLAAPLLSCSYDELKQRHRERRLKKIICAVTAIACLTFAFGAYSIYNYFTIQKNYREKQINQSKYLADTSLSLLEQGDRVTAGLIALEALPSDGRDRPLVTSAQFALSRALYAYESSDTFLKDRLLKHDLPLKRIMYCQNGKALVAIDTGDNIYVWDVNNGELKLKVVPQLTDDKCKEMLLGALLTDENILIIVTEKYVRGINTDGITEWEIENEDYYKDCLMHAETETVIAISGNKIDIVDTRNGIIKETLTNASDDVYSAGSAVINENGTALAVAHFNEDKNKETEISVIDLSTYEVFKVTSAYAYISEIGFSSSDNIVFLSKEDGNMWNYNKDITVKLESKSISDDETIWSRELFISNADIMTYDEEIICINRNQSNSTEKTSEVIIVIENNVYTYEANTGKELSHITTVSDISSVLVSKTSNIGYIVEESGIIDFYDMTTGKRYQDATIEQ